MSRPRRDPREAREMRCIAGGQRPRWGLEARPASGRLRRDPRREIEAARVEGLRRPRLDRTSRSVVPIMPAPVESLPAATPAIRLVENPAFLVAAIPDAPGGRLTPLDRQLLGAARDLADRAGGATLVLAFGSVDGLGPAGADRVITMTGDRSEDPSARAIALATALSSLRPRHVLFPESARGGDLARRVVARTGEELFTGVENLTGKLVTRAAANRRIEQRMAPPGLMTLAADAHSPHAGPVHEAREMPAPDVFPAGGHGAILSVEDLPVAADALSLAEADFVISAGSGVVDFDLFRALARALGATPGASRMVCDAGLMPRAAQVGASGTVLEAACYLALGISGAPQHLQGVARCEHVVAVNTDLHAAMVERAGLAIIADAQPVMSALLAVLQAETQE
ncbi:electron transfer flavoprotein alpha subunit [Ancylobacter sp. 3268]|uniref:electron transfer flavoprotein subunit alpha/FixB family protein n=1 Tax=Ancylobacter sp. 3268 TaxID=2817752 RepID=UPI00285E1BEA|nr:electron transfer flavoprotein subunit alpha/FixB family protein [Ancylobacter sp. 3268]MDR6952140.1 electron transfer flavoprotein alpha subunit [Ancylobacter sp. 3268]